MQSDVRTVMGSAVATRMPGPRIRQPRTCRALDVMQDSKSGRRPRVGPRAGRRCGSHRQNAVVRLGMRRDMVQPLWNGVTIITDEVTL